MNHMYAKRRGVADYEAKRKDPAPLPYLQEALTFATFEPRMYRITQAFLPETS